MNPSVLKELIDIVGEQFVLTSRADLYLYSFDSALDRSLPSAVILPGAADQVARVVHVLAKNKIPYVARGAATSLCGGPVPLHGAAVIGLARLNRIGKLNKEKREIAVEPGVVNLKLQQTVSAEGLFYPPDPGSQKACTIGGNVATNAGGPHCLKYGVTSQFVNALDVVLPDGNMVHVQTNEPGYDLTGLFVGSEGTLGIVTRIYLRLLPKPLEVRTMLVSFRSIEDAIQSVTDIIAAGVLPATLEAMDKTIVAAVEAFVHAGYPLEAEAVLLIEVDGDRPEELDAQVSKIKSVCEANGSFEFRFAKDEAERTKLWEGRRGSYAAMARLAPNVLVEDGAVPRTKLPEALRKIKQIADDAGLRVAMLFHAGDGNLHPQIIFDERDAAHTKIVKEAGHKMLKACVDLGGTISGEHGIGIDKREAMKWLFSRDTLGVFRQVKKAFDPDNVCNPDKLIPLVSKNVTDGKEPPAVPCVVSDVGEAMPETEDQLVSLVRKWAKDGVHYGLQGSASKSQFRERNMIFLTKLNRLLDFDQGNLTVTVQTGASLEAVRHEVEKAGQYLWIAGGGTVGGTIATRSSVSPPLRDLILGMRVVLPTGQLAVLGAKTMKNVAGYDIAKIFIGSWGTIGTIIDVTFRLFPYPPLELRAERPRPFVMKPIHKRVKAMFDPAQILSSRLSNLKLDELPPAEAVKPSDAPVKPQRPKHGDAFWAQE